MHLAFLSGFIILLFGKRKTAFFIIPVLILFTLVVGAPPSVVRALIMHIIMILATTLKGEADSINSLSIALVLILLFNPHAIMDVGLQLSFLATLGLILFGNRINTYIKKPFKTKNKHLSRIVNFFTSTLSTSLSAIIFTTPVIIWYFGRVSLIAPIANVLLLWILNIIFIASIIVVILAFIYMPIAQIIVIPITLCSGFILSAADFIAGIPFADINVEYAYQIVLIVYIYVVFFAFLKDPEKKIFIPFASVALVLVITVLISIVPTKQTQYMGIRFSVLDVGQGSALIADYNGAVVMVDCGGSGAENAGDAALDYIRKIDEDSVDALILTHFDSDHLNGAKNLIEKGQVNELYVSSNAPNDERARVILESAKNCGTRINYVSEQTHINNNNIEFSIYPTGWFSDSNENGLVVIFDKDDFELVVTGDLSKKSERILCENYDLPDAEVYIAGHHGSNSSSGIEFINKILPEFVVISVGADNYYGHPSKEVLSLFDDMLINVARTDVDGDVVFYSDEITREVA